MTDYEFIRGFQNIKLSNICKEIKVAQSNIINGTASEKFMREVKEKILNELLKLMIQYKCDDFILMSLYDEMLLKVEKENKMLREMI